MSESGNSPTGNSEFRFPDAASVRCQEVSE